MKDMDPEMQQWVALHADDDPMRLRMKYHGNDEISQAICQIECRRKAAQRLPLALAAPGFLFPGGLSAEQATSEALARVHADIAGYGEGMRHLDLTAGLAIDAFEAARRGAMVTAIEINPATAAAAGHNARELGLDNVIVHEADSTIFIDSLPEDSFDTIFIDPARRGDYGRRLRAVAECNPDVTQILPRLLTVAPRIIIKVSPMLDASSLASELNDAAGERGAVSRIIAVGTTRECKELVAVVERGLSRPTSLEAVTVCPDDSRVEYEATARSGAPRLIEDIPAEGDILYEPFPSVMKIESQTDLTAIHPSLRQLNANTHLFVSPQPRPSFPGTAIRLTHILPLNDRSLRAIARAYPTINVSTRNFIISAPELARRLRVKEGGTARVYGARIGRSNGLYLLAGTKIFVGVEKND